ncbi:MAG: F0F1 ATP synthase subunit B [Bacteroidetes bacterium]|nr:F0F1 ATP synthase subunit B [Bacteroidota bacterium]
MDLVTPDLGLLFWTGLVFCLLLFVLTKFAWKPILKMVNEREKKIEDALLLADKTKNEMLELKAENDKIMKEANAARDLILKEAKEFASAMVEEAKNKAKIEAQKHVDAARQTIQSEKAAALADIKSHVAQLSLAIAEKVVRGELSSDDKQKAFADKLAGDINLN